MLLTKLWAVILAVMATAALGGMLLLSLGAVGGFSDADRAALRAVTEAGIAALRAEIQSSPVQRSPALLWDPRLKQAMEREDPEKVDPMAPSPLQQTLADVSEEVLLKDHPKMTIGIVGATGAIAAANGIARPLLDEAVATTAFQSTGADQESLFAAVLGGQLQAVMVSRANEQRRRLIAIQILDTGAGSLLRQALGSHSPGGLVNNGKLLGDIIGDQPLQAELEQLAAAHVEEAPDQGASPTFVVGQGLDARIGAIGRVPGPAGRGKNGAVLTVLSRNTAAAGQRDVVEVLKDARQGGQLSRLDWPLLGGLLVVSLALGLYLPYLEAQGPIRRLRLEFEGLVKGTQHQVFHDRYGGMCGELARAAAQAQEQLRSAYHTDVPLDEDSEPAAPAARSESSASSSNRSTLRAQRKSQRLKALATPLASDFDADASAPAGLLEPSRARNDAIDLPNRQDLVVESHSHRESPSPAPSPIVPPKTSPAAAPRGGRDWIDDPAAAELAASLVEPSAPAGPSPIAVPRPAPVVAKPVAAGNGGREDYYRRIYDEFVQTKTACGESVDGFAFDKFAKKLAGNTEELMKRPGVGDVEFTVYVKDGKAALKAKVVKA